MRGARPWVPLVVAGYFAVATASASAFGPLGSEFRVSNVGADGDPSRRASASDVAHNTAANQYLVVWTSDQLNDGEYEVYGQRLSATGAQLGGDFRISNVGTDGDTSRDACNPAEADEACVPRVAYNPTDNEYLVVWHGDHQANQEFEVFGQRVSAAGAQIDSDFRISNAGTDGDAARDAGFPEIAYNSTDNEYLVIWVADDLATNDEVEVFGQRLSATGAELGSNDFRISNEGTDTDATRGALQGPSIAYNSTNNQYLVVWEGDGVGADDAFRISAQRVSALGSELGSDFQVSFVPDSDGLRDAFNPAVAYNHTANDYLVVWEDDGTPAADNDFDIWGQLVTFNGALSFGVDVSNVPGSDRTARRAALAYSGAANEYLAVWHGDGLGTDEELEIFGQRVSADASRIGGDFRISQVGTDGDASRDAFQAALAYNAAANEYLATWEADDLPVDNEVEIWGRRVGNPPPPPARAAAPPLLPSNAFDFAKVKRNKKKGIAFLIVRVPGPGQVGLAGKGIKNRPLSTSGGRVKLKVVPTKKGRGKKIRNRLRTKGKAKVKVRVTYVPSGGMANTRAKGIKLLRK